MWWCHERNSHANKRGAGGSNTETVFSLRRKDRGRKSEPSVPQDEVAEINVELNEWSNMLVSDSRGKKMGRHGKEGNPPGFGGKPSIPPPINSFGCGRRGNIF